MIRFLKALAVAMAFTLGIAMPASADVCPSCNGGLVANMSSSSNLILIWNGSQTASLYPGQVSERFTYWQDVDSFQSPYCDAQRYESGKGWTTIYKRGVWYAIGDSANISVRVAWC